MRDEPLSAHRRRLVLRGLAAGGLRRSAVRAATAGRRAGEAVSRQGRGPDRAAQRALLGRATRWRRNIRRPTSADFKPNGTIDPDNPDYQARAQDNFADWKLEVDGLVERPMSLSLADLRAMPSRTQITRHDCVEGWSCIGKWTGVRLGAV